MDTRLAGLVFAGNPVFWLVSVTFLRYFAQIVRGDWLVSFAVLLGFYITLHAVDKIQF